MCHVPSPHKRGKIVPVTSPDYEKINMFKTSSEWVLIKTNIGYWIFHSIPSLTRQFPPQKVSDVYPPSNNQNPSAIWLHRAMNNISLTLCRALEASRSLYPKLLRLGRVPIMIRCTFLTIDIPTALLWRKDVVVCWGGDPKSDLGLTLVIVVLYAMLKDIGSCYTRTRPIARQDRQSV